MSQDHSKILIPALVMALTSSFPWSEATRAQSESDSAKNLWLEEVAIMQFPREFARGKLHGRPFKVENADFDGQFLHLVQGESWITAKLCLIVVMKDQKIEEKDYFVLPGRADSSKQITGVNKIWENADGTHTTRALPGGYAMRLHFGKQEHGLIPTYLIVRIDDHFRGAQEHDQIAGFCQVKLTPAP